MRYPKSKTIPGTHFIGTLNGSKIPIYDIITSDGLNQIIGYIKHINASDGTVLYRGQCDLHDHVIPSIEHHPEDYDLNKERLNVAIHKLSEDAKINSFFSWDALVRGWETYINITLEAVLQHYGAATNSLDLVDNHWAALWFSLFRYDKIQKQYVRRTKDDYVSDAKKISFAPYYPTFEDSIPEKPGDYQLTKKDLATIESIHKKTGMEILEIEQKYREKKICKQLSEYNNALKKYKLQKSRHEKQVSDFNERCKLAHAYLFLYLADTNESEIQGLYIGKKSYTVDLRKALPSTFLRPVAQHGWIVRGKENGFSFDSNILCVLRLPVELVDTMLGTGTLLSQNNFFPEYHVDEGYKVLLTRQEDSGLTDNTRDILLPKDMISTIFY